MILSSDILDKWFCFMEFLKIQILSKFQEDCHRLSQYRVKKCKRLFQAYLARKESQFAVSAENRFKRFIASLRDLKVWNFHPIVLPRCQTFPSILHNPTHVAFCEPVTSRLSISMIIHNGFESLHFHVGISLSRIATKNWWFRFDKILWTSSCCATWLNQCGYTLCTE
jgi:adenosine deaminase